MNMSRDRLHAFETLKARPDFLRVQGSGKKWVSQSLILQVCKMPDEVSETFKGIRVGYTVTKKTDKSAVVRNRIKRRLRSVARDVLALHAKEGYDYALVGRPAGAMRDYKVLCADLIWCLKKMDLYQKEQEHAHGC